MNNDLPTDPMMKLIGKVATFMFSQYINVALIENPPESLADQLGYETIQYIKEGLKINNPHVAYILAIEGTREIERIIRRKGDFAITN